MTDRTLTVTLTDTAADNDAIALIAPLGIDTTFQRFVSFEPPKDWTVTILSEPRCGVRAALLEPPHPEAKAVLRHVFSLQEGADPANAYETEGTRLAAAASDLAAESRGISEAAGGGLAGMQALVQDTADRFDYEGEGAVDRYYEGAPGVPLVACAAGNCIDINTYLIAALRAAGFEACYFTGYFFDEEPDRIPSGMHCWVRARHGDIVRDWDITHFKKTGQTAIEAGLNPVAGQRFALSFGRDHAYRWNGMTLSVPTPSRPQWISKQGLAGWGAAPEVTLT